jgi:hypothetical protein
MQATAIKSNSSSMEGMASASALKKSREGLKIVRYKDHSMVSGDKLRIRLVVYPLSPGKSEDKFQANS